MYNSGIPKIMSSLLQVVNNKFNIISNKILVLNVLIFLVLIHSSSSSSSSSSHQTTQQLPPVVVLPGILCSRLGATLNNATDAPIICPRNSKFYNIWISDTQFFHPSCFYRRMASTFKNENRKKKNNTSTPSQQEQQQCVHNSPGVTIGPIGYGNMSGCNCLNPEDVGPKLNLFLKMTNTLEKYGYVPGKNLKAVTYDWRLYGDPCFTPILFTQIKEMIETSYSNNGNTPVVALCHSMGCPILHKFFVSQTKEWKDLYISQFINICAPFAGAGNSLVEFINAKPFEWIDRSYVDYLSPVFRSWPGTSSLFPQQIMSKTGSTNNVWGNITFVQTPDKNYTGADSIYEILELLSNDKKRLKEHNYIDYGLKFWNIQEELRNSVLNKSPGVKSTSCLFLLDVPTPIGSIYADNMLRKHVKDFFLPGDGTVSSISVEGPCTIWKNQGENISIEPFHLGKKVTHKAALSSMEIINRVVEKLVGNVVG